MIRRMLTGLGVRKDPTPFWYLLFYLLLVVFFIGAGPSASDYALFIFSILLASSSITAIYAVWRIIAGISNRAADKRVSHIFFEPEQQKDGRLVTEQLVTYRNQLREIALYHERQRRILTGVAIVLATSLILVPVVTWLAVLMQAFGNDKTMPNAWLLVVSSMGAGILGIAIAVTILRHTKTVSLSLNDIQHRLLGHIEMGIVLASDSVDHDVQKFALMSYIRQISFLQSPAPERSDEEKTPDSKTIADIASTILKSDQGV